MASTNNGELKDMEKDYHFLAGIPRSGNTLLSSILNQNPEIYSSALSPVNGILSEIDNVINNHQHIKRNSDNNANEFAKDILKNYYKKINKPIIIDREKVWGTPINLSLIKQYITTTPKIIFTVRPIIEVLASFINILPEHSYLDEEMKISGYLYKNYLSKNDNRCDYLMRPVGLIDRCMFSINEIIKEENKEVFCIVKYDEIVNTPQEVMNRIYNFLQIPYYKHDFNNIVKVEKDNDQQIGQPKDMHKVRKQLKKISKSPEEILSNYVISKYSNIGWGKM
jgi:sulfotransferase